MDINLFKGHLDLLLLRVLEREKGDGLEVGKGGSHRCGLAPLRYRFALHATPGRRNTTRLRPESSSAALVE